MWSRGLYPPPLVAPCSDQQWTCFNRGCISKDEMCNGVDNCGDNSDETYAHARCSNGMISQRPVMVTPVCTPRNISVGRNRIFRKAVFGQKLLSWLRWNRTSNIEEKNRLSRTNVRMYTFIYVRSISIFFDSPSNSNLVAQISTRTVCVNLSTQLHHCMHSYRLLVIRLLLIVIVTIITHCTAFRNNQLFWPKCDNWYCVLFN